VEPSVGEFVNARAKERRGNLIAVGVLFGAVIVLGLLAYRPATVLGIDGETLANSLGEELGLVPGKRECEKQADDEWRCSLSGGSSEGGGGMFVVSTRAFGCWDAEQVSSAAGPGTPRPVSGCIDAFDIL
jgi:hypothetical protein